MINNNENCTELDGIALPILDNIFIEDDGGEGWRGSKYKKQRMLQIDKRGSMGERFFAIVLFNLYPRRIEYNDGDQGDWDLKIKNFKFEIKTASLGKNMKTFQNEGLKKNGDYDGILFLGIAPNQLYIYFIKKSYIDFDNKIINHNGKTFRLHNRGKDGSENNATGVGYKWDFKVTDMIPVNTLQDIKREFEKEFVGLVK